MATVSLPELTVEGAPTPAAPPPEAAVQGFAPAPGMFAIKDPDGSVSMVKQEDARAALAEGAVPASVQDIDVAAAQKDWRGGIGGQLASASMGALRGLTFGLSDAAIIGGSRALGGNESAESSRRALNAERATHGTADTLGEIGGTLGSLALLPGGAVGGAVKGEGLLARAGARFAASAPRAALEGGVIGVGHQASEDALGNHEATAEKYLTSGIGGVVFGGLLGGGLHAVGGGILDAARPLYGKVADVAVRAGEDEGAGLGAKLRNAASDQAEQQAFKATGAKIRDIQKLGATADAQGERMGRIGRKLLDEGIVDATASQETIAQRLTAKTREVGEELSAMRTKLDKAVERPSMTNIMTRFDEKVLKPLSELPMAEAEARPATEFLASMAKKGGERPDFATLYKYRRRLDDLLERGGEYSRIPGGPSKLGAEPLRTLRGIVEEEFELAAERAAKETGDTFANKYQLTKELYSDLRTAEKISVKEAARANANRAISLTDTIAAGSAFAGGAQKDDATGVALSAAALLGNRAIRTHGNQIAASLLNKASRLGLLQRAAESVDIAVKDGVRGFLSGAARKPTQAPKVTPETVAKVREAVRDPSAVVARLNDTLGNRGLVDAAPKATQAMAVTMMRAAAYLRDKAPKEPAPTGLSFLPEKTKPPSQTELSRYANVVNAVNNPLSVVDDLRQGRLNREKVEAIKVVYPQLYQHIRSELTAQATQLRPKLDTQKQIALSILFDVPVSAMMTPEAIASFQKTIAQGAESPKAAEAGQPPTTVRGLNRKGTLAAGFDAQEAPT